MSFKFISKDVNDTDLLADKFSKLIDKSGAFICLFGDVGTGKTTFTKSVCKYIGVKEKVTSPSFVILNEYKSGKLPVYHFDLYRLEKDGINSIVNELEEYSEGNIITFVEWAQFSHNILPFDRLDININYIDEMSREFIFTSFGEKSNNILKGLENENIGI